MRQLLALYSISLRVRMSLEFSLPSINSKLLLFELRVKCVYLIQSVYQLFCCICFQMNFYIIALWTLRLLKDFPENSKFTIIIGYSL